MVDKAIADGHPPVMGSKNQHTGISTWSGMAKGMHRNNKYVDAGVSECERVCGCEGVCVNRKPNPSESTTGFQGDVIFGGKSNNIFGCAATNPWRFRRSQ